MWGGCAVALGCAGQSLKQSPTTSGGKLPSHCMDGVGSGAGSRARGCLGQKEERGVMDTQCSIPQESEAAQGMRSSEVLHGQLMERGGWRSCPALWSSLLHQLDLPLQASSSHLRAICPSLPAGGQQPSSHEQPCQVCSRSPAQPRLGKLGPKYRAKSRCSPWVTAHSECHRPGSISTDPCTEH